MSVKKAAFICVSFFVFHHILFTQTERFENRITVTEKSDYSTYINGKYKGLTYYEARFYLVETETVHAAHSVFNYEGEAFILRKTRKNMANTLLPIDTVLPIAFTLNTDPARVHNNPYQAEDFTKDFGYPLFRSFPVLPDKKLDELLAGEKWEGRSTVSVKPKPDKKSVRVPIFAEFEYRGKTVYNGINVHYVQAVFALRYKKNDSSGDAEMIKSEGSRKADIYYDEETHKLLFIREKIEEEFFYKDGGTIKNRGFLLHFYSYSGSGRGSVKKTEVKPILPSKNFDVTQTKRGTVLTLKNLNFAADKTELLAGEENKLAEIAAILQASKAPFFFIEGHTADVGKSENQQLLSLERAETVVKELIKLGIDADQCIYAGAGGSKPIASNETEEGRAKNRRVEITIME